jgi:hypothetical protein
MSDFVIAPDKRAKISPFCRTAMGGKTVEIKWQHLSRLYAGNDNPGKSLR